MVLTGSYRSVQLLGSESTEWVGSAVPAAAQLVSSSRAGSWTSLLYQRARQLTKRCKFAAVIMTWSWLPRTRSFITVFILTYVDGDLIEWDGNDGHLNGILHEVGK